MQQQAKYEANRKIDEQATVGKQANDVRKLRPDIVVDHKTVIDHGTENPYWGTGSSVSSQTTVTKNKVTSGLTGWSGEPVAVSS